MLDKAMYLIKLSRAIALVLSLLSAGCWPHAGTQVAQTKRDSRDTGLALMLDVSPMMNPMSTLLIIGQDGSARSVRYARTRLLVVSARAGHMTGEQRNRITRQAREKNFRAACNGQHFGNDGLTRGDQFKLAVKAEDGAALKCVGFKEDAPPEVQRLLDDLLLLAEQLPPAALADAYVRSSPMTDERLAAIRRAGQMRFANLTDFSPKLQSLLTASVNQPDEFIPLTRQDYETMRASLSSAYDFILKLDSSSYQSTLFEAQPLHPQQGEKDGPPT